jgi:uncharacterized protein YqjF (DUF2071 family)
VSEHLATPFLTARWSYLAMLNFVVDPALLRPLVPIGTELDFDRDETFLSVVGVMFLDTRVLGVAIPLHRNFEEVNLRFYVRRKTTEGWRRGVVFIRELVPRFAIATVARVFYNEPYSAMRMAHSISHERGRLAVEYRWLRGRAWEFLAITGSGEPNEAAPGSHEEFITEHYWGYTAGERESSEYQVEHPRWRLWDATTHRLHADLEALYGQPFVETLTAAPASAFIADGSPVTVRRRGHLRV